MRDYFLFHLYNPKITGLEIRLSIGFSNTDAQPQMNIESVARNAH